MEAGLAALAALAALGTRHHLPSRPVLARLLKTLGTAGFLRALAVRDLSTLREAGLVKPTDVALLLKVSCRQLESAVRLCEMRVQPKLVLACLDAWQDEAPDKVCKDPFGAIREVKGTLAEADAIAACLRLSSRDRSLGHAAWILEDNSCRGHTLMPSKILVQKLRHELDIGLPAATALLDDLVGCGKLVVMASEGGEQGVATCTAHETETYIAAQCGERGGQSSLLKIENLDLARLAAADPELTPDQLGALTNAFLSKLSVVTGGPGTGKSRIVRALVRYLGPDKCVVMAPTGRAARNLEGKTVHYFMQRRTIQEAKEDAEAGGAGVDPVGGGSGQGPSVIVVDESSMLTSELMKAVLDLAPRTTNIVLVGDADQLPPIGSGHVLVDILSSKTCPVTVLSRNHRCDSGIAEFAAAVLRGKLDFQGGLPAGVESVCARDMCAAVKYLVTRPLTPGLAKFPHILVPHNDTRKLLNRAMQLRVWGSLPVAVTSGVGLAAGSRGTMRLAPDGSAEILVVNGTRISMALADALAMTTMDLLADPSLFVETVDPGTYAREGDEVIVTKNKEGEACNGDIGVLERSGESGQLQVRFGEGEAVTSTENLQFTLSYATTIHKFQGSEVDEIVLPLIYFRSWSTPLLYTAVTRAKNRVILLGSVDVLEAVVEKEREPRRKTVLASLLASS